MEYLLIGSLIAATILYVFYKKNDEVKYWKSQTINYKLQYSKSALLNAAWEDK